jgi:uncharacterized Zn-binding protein involved in type VI secretion
MAVTIHVNGTSNSLAHKGSSGLAKSTLPDVCKTPSPGGPVPVPYPVILSLSSDLANGSKTVKVDGGNMAAIKGSELKRCTGDEPGTAGGVKSSTNMKEAKWILYSFDVKIDGKNACRLGDKLTMNHGNTVCLGGWLQRPVIVGSTDEEKVACAIYCCDNMKYQQTKGDPERECQRLASKKHSCVTHSLRKTIGGGGTLTQDSKFPGIEAAPQFPPSATGADRTLIPDIKIGGEVIDAKFPCKRPVPSGEFVHTSDMSLMGKDKITPKEDDYYDIEGVKDVRAMTPGEAKTKKSADCTCEVEYERTL